MKNSNKGLYTLTIKVSDLIINSFFNIKVHGLENLEKIAEKNFLIVSNHTSYIDHLLIGTVTYKTLKRKFKDEQVVYDKQPYLMAKEELFDFFFLGNYIRKLKAIPFNRKFPRKEKLADFVNLLNQGNSLIIYPEGTTKKSKEIIEKDDIKEFGSIVGYVAYNSNVQILPTYIKGLRKWSRAFLIPKSRKVDLYFGEPILIEKEQYKNSRDAYKCITKDLEQEIRKLSLLTM